MKVAAFKNVIYEVSLGRGASLRNGIFTTTAENSEETLIILAEKSTFCVIIVKTFSFSVSVQV